MPEGEDLATLGPHRARCWCCTWPPSTWSGWSAELLPHYGADCPAAVVAMASRPDELVLRGTLADIAGQVREAGVVRTAVILVGRTLAAEQFGDSHLYSPARDRQDAGPGGS